MGTRVGVFRVEQCGCFDEFWDVGKLGDYELYRRIERNEAGETYPYLERLYLCRSRVENMFEVVDHGYWVRELLLFDSEDELRDYLRRSVEVEMKRLQPGDLEYFPANINEIREKIIRRHENRKG